MAEKTGIAWTDSTHNPWRGCTKVGPACDHCYAEGVDKRGGGDHHWGQGVPRLLHSDHTRNALFRWQKRADKFFAEHGRDRRVFTLSMGDLFDNEVDVQWRNDQMGAMAQCDRLKLQICTKRISNLPKMIFPSWETKWPQHIGVLITVVTQAEADRDISRLLECKKRFGIPWVGISYEPAQEVINWQPWLRPRFVGTGLDWIIFGGKSGPKWNDRPFDIEWGRKTRDQCAAANVAFFMKQVAALQPAYDMVPSDMRLRQFPAALS